MFMTAPTAMLDLRRGGSVNLARAELETRFAHQLIFRFCPGTRGALSAIGAILSSGRKNGGERRCWGKPKTATHKKSHLALSFSFSLPERRDRDRSALS